MLKNIKRTGKNDLVLSNSKNLSIQNIILVLSIVMFLLTFTPYIKVDGFLGIAPEKYNLFSMIKQLGKEFGAKDILNLILLLSLLSPVIHVGLYFVNLKLSKKNNSYAIVMTQYIEILIFGTILFAFSQFASIIILYFGGFSGIQMTFFSLLYRLFNLCLMILAIIGIIATGNRAIDQTATVKEVFSKENFDKAVNFADKVKTEVGSKIASSNADQSGEGGVYCTGCGAQNKEDSKFCRQCGSKIAAVEVQTGSGSSDERTEIVERTEINHEGEKSSSAQE